MRARTKRLIVVSVAGVLLLSSGLLAFSGLRDFAVFFVGPAEAVERGVIASGQRVRLGGLVEVGSVTQPGGDVTLFRVTDGEVAHPVTYTGPVPDLFKEGQGVIAEGRFRASDGLFIADRVLARHDERYVPREVKRTLEDTGHWRPELTGDAPATPAADGAPRAY
jgi:cytochrome c-type biogenesis protein CcmE